MLTAPRLRGSRGDRGRSGPSSNFRRGGGGIGFGSGPGGGGGGGGFSLTLKSTVPDGTFVHAGTVVAEFDREEMEQRFEDYSSSLSQSDAAYADMLAGVANDRATFDQQLKTAQANYDKAKLDLQTIPVLSAINAEHARLAVQEAEATLKEVRQQKAYNETGIQADLTVAKLELNQTRLEVERARTNLDKMVLKAPIDGIVVLQSVRRGNEIFRIKPGDQMRPGQNVIQIVDPRAMIVNATANQADTEKLRIGQSARVHFDGFPNLVLPARVFSIGSVGTVGQYRPEWVSEIPVMLRLEKMDPQVIPDLTVSADVITASSSNGVLLPREAVFQDDDSSYVYVKTGDGWRRQDVELGPADNTRVIITDGVDAGATVALQAPGRTT